MPVSMFPVQRAADLFQRQWQLAHHDLSRNAHHPIARALKVTVPASISSRSRGVVPAINFKDDFGTWSGKISDEFADRILAFEGNLQLLTANSLPKRKLRRRLRVPHGASALRDELFARC